MSDSNLVKNLAPHLRRVSESEARRVIERQVGRIQQHAENRGERISYDQARSIAVSDQVKIDRQIKENKR